MATDTRTVAGHSTATAPLSITTLAITTLAIAPPSIRPLAITMGDPAGIGLDIILKAFCGSERPRLPPLVIFGDPAAIAARAQQLNLAVEIEELPEALAGIGGVASVPAGPLPVLPVRCAVTPRCGVPDPANAPAVIAAIELATAAVAQGHAAALVTSPIAKATLTAAGFRHPGHTEFLAELAGHHFPGRPWLPVMMLASDALRVVPLTVHVPLARVPSLVTKDLICSTVAITAAGLTRWYGIAKPRIWIAGLNPHAGESGTLGREELDIITPAVAALRALGHDVTGPLSADTMFHAAARTRYDAAIAMYHDQALIPLKTLAFDSGVNVTLGLPFIRTSPDHGTAFDIAGSGHANPQSFIAAVHLAAAMASRSAAASTAGAS